MPFYFYLFFFENPNFTVIEESCYSKSINPNFTVKEESWYSKSICSIIIIHKYSNKRALFCKESNRFDFALLKTQLFNQDFFFYLLKIMKLLRLIIILISFLHKYDARVSNGDWNTVCSMVNEGFNVNVEDKLGKPLALIAAENGEWNITHWLIRKGANINSAGKDQRTLLHIAALQENWQDVKYLVKNGSNVNAADHLHRTAAITAGSKQNWTIVKWLLTNGANINAKDKFSRSLLMLAAEQKNWNIVKWLIENGADVKTTDVMGRTILHHAAYSGRLNIVQYLVEDMGADFSQKDSRGLTPIQLSITHSDADAFTYKYLTYMRDQKSTTFRRSETQFSFRNYTLLNRMNKMYYLIKEGEKQLEETYRRLVLVLGNSGSGKSTLVDILTKSDNDNLISEEIGENIRVFRIVNRNPSNVSSVIPRFVKHETKQSIFCDGPSFSDFGVISKDLTVLHLLKTLTDRIKRVKLVFTLSWQTIRTGMDTEEFVIFLQHATSFIGDYTKFYKSICMIITKVEDYRKDFKIATTIKNVAHFIFTMKINMARELKEKNVVLETANFYKKAIEFLDIFLHMDKNGEYDRIKILRRPMEPGPLSKIKEIQEQKSTIDHFIHKVLKYVVTKQMDFDYALSNINTGTIFKNSLASSKEIKFAMSELADNIVHEMHLKALTTDDPYKLRHLFEEGCLRTNQMYESLSESDSARTMLSTVDIMSSTLEIHPTAKEVHAIPELSKFSNFLQKLHNTNFNTLEKRTWMFPFRNTAKSICTSRNWYQFLVYTAENLVQYDIQKNRTLFNVTNLQNWGKGERNSNGILINKDNVDQFIDIMKNRSVRRSDVIESRNFYDSELQSLQKILDLYIREDVFVDCEKLIMKGTYVSLHYFEKKCGILKEVNASSIQIFATNKVFIDADIFSVGERINVTIIAPIWEIIGERKFDLGVNGSFKGIGKCFKNGENLKILNNENHTTIPHEVCKNTTQIYIGPQEGQSLHDLECYRFFLAQYANNAMVSDKIREFDEQLNSNPEIMSQYNTETLLNELLCLEEKFIEYKDRVQFLPLYESLLKRMDIYLKNPRESEDNDSYKIALTRYYVVTLSKIISLNQKNRGIMVLDIAKHLKLGVYMVEQVKKRGNKDVTTYFTTLLQRDLQRMIDDGYAKVKELVPPFMEQIYQDINRTIDDLISEAKYSKKSLHKTQDGVREYTRKLDKYYDRKIQDESKLLKGAKILDVLASSGNAIHDAFKALSHIYDKPELPDYNKTVDVRKRLEKTVKYFYTNLSIIKTELNYVRKYLEMIGRDVAKEFEGLFCELEQWENLLPGEYEVKVREFVRKLDKKMKAYEGNHNKLYEEAKPILERFRRRLIISPRGAFPEEELTELKQEDTQFLKALNTDLKSRINSYKKYINKIKKDVVEMLNAMRNDFYNVSTNMTTMSAVMLRLDKWKVHSTLRGVQRMLSMMMDGFGDQDNDMKAHIQNLTAAMDVQIAVYKKLQDYSEQIILVQYMNNITNPDFFRQAYPWELKDGTEKLDLMLSANILVYHLERVINALKQWVFPFAHNYLEEYQIPKELYFKQNITEKVKLVKEQIASIRERVFGDSSILTKKDACFFKNEFYLENPKGPFYVWKNEDNKELIRKLLSGDEVTTNVPQNFLRYVHCGCFDPTCHYCWFRKC
ncbi:hypothetical protein C0J52_22356 [Blattella germanica]|nr:hypothetical protein C0J52_22356 [Blattella germanica]